MICGQLFVISGNIDRLLSCTMRKFIGQLSAVASSYLPGFVSCFDTQWYDQHLQLAYIRRLCVHPFEILANVSPRCRIYAHTPWCGTMFVNTLCSLLGSLSLFYLLRDIGPLISLAWRSPSLGF